TCSTSVLRICDYPSIYLSIYLGFPSTIYLSQSVQLPVYSLPKCTPALPQRPGSPLLGVSAHFSAESLTVCQSERNPPRMSAWRLVDDTAWSGGVRVDLAARQYRSGTAPCTRLPCRRACTFAAAHGKIQPGRDDRAHQGGSKPNPGISGLWRIEIKILA